MARYRNKALEASGLLALAGVGAVLAFDHWNIGDPPADFLHKGFKRRELATPPGRMTYYEAGAGEPLVFLHGIGGGASSWTWSRVAPAFADRFRVVVPDWVGWGLSEHPVRFLQFEDYVASLEALLDHIGEAATIVAQSLACGFAAALAERRPDLVRRFIFHTPSGGYDFGEDAFGPVARAAITPVAKMPGVNLLFYKALFHRSQFIGGWFRQEGFYDPSGVTREIVDGFLYSARQPNGAYSALPFATGELRYDFAPYFRNLKVPAAVLWGAQETQVGSEVRERLAALRPDIPFTVLERAKACPELELPHEVTAITKRVLEQPPGAATGEHAQVAAS